MTPGSPMTTRLPVGSLLIAGLALALVATTCSSRRALDARDTELDSIRSEETRLRADSAGWATAWAVEVEHGQSLGSIVAAQDQRLRILGLIDNGTRVGVWDQMVGAHG